jgi:phenylpropionate dioxygenase-like ring-hydroxylating dioxygenase large terminal subunit
MQTMTNVIIAYILLTPILFVDGFINILPFKRNNIKNIEIEPADTFILPPVSICDDEKYNLNWYVIGEEKKIKKNKINKATIWGKNYAFWNNGTSYFCVDDSCTHRGASLSIGKLNKNNIVCPYHAYEFDTTGKLSVVPGLPNFQNTPCQNLNSYPILVKNGWIYVNTISENKCNKEVTEKNVKLFEEPESKDEQFKPIFLNKDFNAYGRIVSENSLDIMHIGFVHTFGNAKSPSPLNEVPPFKVDDVPFHYKTIYNYTSGENSMVKRVFQMDDLLIENEFILPHTTIARVIFGPFKSTIITFALPVNVTHSKLFVKAYRNFWYSYDSPYFKGWLNNLGDYFTTDTMSKTIIQDKIVIESIPLDKVDGLFNMKYDKLQNLYTSLYKKLIHNISTTL